MCIRDRYQRRVRGKNSKSQMAGNLLLAAALLASCLANPAPNVLVLFADDAGAGDFGCYGHPTIQTPHIDKLAADGVRFTQWYSGFHVCSPSRASIMTGRLPIRSGTAGAAWTGGVFNADAVGGLPLNETTIAEVLRKAGYRTAAVGKWHLGQQKQFLPTSRGFDEYLGVPYSVDMGSSPWDRYNSEDRPPLPLLRNLEVVEQPTDLNKLSDRYTDFVREFIRNSTADSARWFVYMAFNHVHVPDFATKQFCNSSRRGRFGDAVSEMDSTIGKILEVVAEVGAEEETIVFFTSDNGPWLIKQLYGGSAGLLRDGKTTTWEGGVREPGIVRWPGVIPAGLVTQEVATTYDIMPTVASLAGVDLPSDRIYDGKDLSPFLRALASPSPIRSPHQCIFHYKGTPNTGCPKSMASCPGLWAVRCGAYKMHWVTSEWTTGSSNGKLEDPPLLFQLEHDPGESFGINPNSTE
eukprot:TRINITY_DN11303_c0_g1_i3.p1 TRINITY_DN11303_c0_g1~~TRINITY_DN11303_c0_g1_i3.p1  ORF type:complete len:465 (-),score=95.90 TRINITY_DN11303_c0_g1_i3:653-2047(-)